MLTATQDQLMDDLRQRLRVYLSYSGDADPALADDTVARTTAAGPRERAPGFAVDLSVSPASLLAVAPMTVSLSGPFRDAEPGARLSAGQTVGGRGVLEGRRLCSGSAGGDGGGSGSGFRRPGGRVVRVMPEGVVTCRVPSASMTKCQPRAKVFSRWWERHRQHRLRAGGRAAAGVRDDVVEVGPADPLPAVGHPAGAVPGGDEVSLPVGRCVAVGVRRRRRAPGSRSRLVGVVGAARPGQPQQLGDGGGGQQPPVGVGDREGEAAALRGGQARARRSGRAARGRGRR